MRVILVGANGRMGKTVRSLMADREDMTLEAGIDCSADEKAGFFRSLSDYHGKADLLLDFSHHDGTAALLSYAVCRRLPCVIATTGQNAREMGMLREASETVPIFLSANMSVGVAILADAVRCAAAYLPAADIEILETHHRDKLDAPSGTAMLLADEISRVRENMTYVCGRYGHRRRTANEIGIHSVRRGNAVGEHTVIFSTGTETISFTHTAESRTLFAEGALMAADFLMSKPAGLYGMEDLIHERGALC